ncbi:NAD(P)/FAD-dependent oxidoreductase [Micromonospora sp. LOL_023]|uniref:NAD(P)/FAD-dependent oxidoreductase n=1 Tax=Micromonospora sp. LOL_023 TaxID=3345418 RepID=UPI003A8AD1A0
MIGSGVAGLVTARVLSDHVDRVTVLERDRLPGDAVARRGAPQARHSHLLLAAGQRLLDGWFPGLAGALAAAGAVPLPAAGPVWQPTGDDRMRLDLGLPAMSMSQPLLEGTIRQCLLRQRSNVSIIDQTAVDGPVVTNGRVTGVRVDAVAHHADLVVACTGRNTYFLDQLARLGFPAPEMSAVRIDMAYASQVVGRGLDDLDGTAAVVLDDLTGGYRLGLMMPLEGERWMITLGARHGEVPPSDPAEYEAFARSLPSPTIAEVLARAQPLSPVRTCRIPTDQRRHVERLDRIPPGFLVLGDAIRSANPIYFQGVTSAALQARALSQALDRHGTASPELPRDFYRQVGEVVDTLVNRRTPAGGLSSPPTGAVADGP